MQAFGAKKTTVRVLTSAVMLLIPCVTCSFAATITNGDFEDIQISGSISNNPADIPGWTHNGSSGDTLLVHAGRPICCGGTGTSVAGHGDQFVVMGGGFDAAGSAAWSQTIQGLTAGDSYVITFMTAAEGETLTQQITAGLTSGSSTPPKTFTTKPTSSLFWLNWGTDSYGFVATATSATLQFSVTDQQYDVGLDNVSISSASSVPEPTSWPCSC